MHTDLTDAMRNLVDEFKNQIRNEMKLHEAMILQRYENRRSTTVNVDKATEYKGLRKYGDNLSSQPGVPRDSSTPGLFLRKCFTSIKGDVGRPVQKPTLYDGKTPWESYLAQFNIIADMNAWGDQEKAAFLASSLTGTALNVLSNLPPERRHNFESLVKALDSRYGNAHRTELARARFKNRIKQKDESLPALAEDIERLARLSYPDAPESITDTLARDQFVDALPDEDMRLRLKQERPQTLQRAQEIALELESFQLANRQTRARVRAVQVESKEDKSQGLPRKSDPKKDDKEEGDKEKPAEQNLSMAMLEMMARLERTTRKCVEQMRNTSGIRRRKRSPQQGDKECWNCGLPGHMRRNCPERSPRPNRNRQQREDGKPMSRRETRSSRFCGARISYDQNYAPSVYP